MTQKITKDDVQKIADLTNIPLGDSELAEFSEIFSDTLEYIEVLDELATSNVKETFQVNGLTNVFQSPDLSETLSQEEALSNASLPKDKLFGTRAVFDR